MLKYPLHFNILWIFSVSRVLANYIVWSVIQDEVPYLSSKFLKARMHYKEKILGSKGLRKRWKTCVSYTNEYLGEILGALYIKQRPNNKYKAIVSIKYTINTVSNCIPCINERFFYKCSCLTREPTTIPLSQRAQWNRWITLKVMQLKVVLSFGFVFWAMLSFYHTHLYISHIALWNKSLENSTCKIQFESAYKCAVFHKKP